MAFRNLLSKAPKPINIYLLDCIEIRQNKEKEMVPFLKLIFIVETFLTDAH